MDDETRAALPALESRTSTNEKAISDILGKLSALENITFPDTSQFVTLSSLDELNTAVAELSATVRRVESVTENDAAIRDDVFVSNDVRDVWVDTVLEKYYASDRPTVVRTVPTGIDRPSDVFEPG